MAMLRHRAAAGSTLPTRLLYSSRTFEDIIFRGELERLASPAAVSLLCEMGAELELMCLRQSAPPLLPARRLDL
jgi:ferredoxin-NADP reductase